MISERNQFEIKKSQWKSRKHQEITLEISSQKEIIEINRKSGIIPEIWKSILEIT